ncbi:S41 family peptidase [Aquimarina sp. D1M17]|uniref:S41 family peptidase n=1 Tax=Aquimarina acroporae TaxID=2937283 RepID=UPI0020C185C5|nr:S41 family peptidase [Aquimarina acroporae]MCK8523508.1 S41 family peptidase [Aquimarina acroporae]
MNKNRIYRSILVSLLIVMQTARAQEHLIYEPGQMLADLKKFKNVLTKVHPGTFTHQTYQEFDQMVNVLKFQTSKPMQAKEFYKVILRLVANLHDGHTQAYSFGKLGNIINNQKRFPFQIYIKDERLFIVKNLSLQEIIEGSEILSINGNLSNEIIFEILEHYSSDGKSHNGMRHWLGGPYKPFYNIYPEIFGEQATYDLVYRDVETHKIAKTKVKSISKEDYKKRESIRYTTKATTEEAFSFDINKNDNYAYLKINRFFKTSYDEPENTYPIFYKQCFKEIAYKNIKNLIIDLRNNGGGKASNAAYLLQYLVNQNFTPAKEITTMGDDKYFLNILGDSLNLNEPFGLKQKKDGTYKVTDHKLLRDLMNYAPIEEYQFKGKLIVLINGGTSSAAGIAAGLLKQYTNASLVGTETYGYAGISNGIRQISVKGDHTEVAIYLPLLHAKYNINKHIQKRTVVPDYNVSSSIRDIVDGKDVILQFALKNLLTTSNKNQ